MDKKVLIQDLADGLVLRRGLPKKDADVFVRSVFEIIGEYLQTDKIVKVKGLGTFKLVMNVVWNFVLKTNVMMIFVVGELGRKQ